MPLRSDPQTAAQDWATGLQNATPKIQRGIQRVTQAPGVKAAQKVDKYRQGVMDNIGKWQRNTAAVDLPTWQAAADAGVSRIADGASRKQGKYADAVAPVFQHMSNVLGQVDSMPDATLDQRIAKSAAFQRGMAAFGQRAGR